MTALVHIGFNNPELFRVLLNDRSCEAAGRRRQRHAARSIFRRCNGSVNPADGQLYIAGFQILGWGTTATRLAGLGRVRYTGAPSTVPRDSRADGPGRAAALRRAARRRRRPQIPDNYSLATWHYKRTYQYGSPQFKADGTTGIDLARRRAARISRTTDAACSSACRTMKPVMQMRIGWSLATATA